MKKSIFFFVTLSLFVFSGCEKNEDSSSQVSKTSVETVHEFALNSFTEIVDGKYFPQFSQKELRVKKGETVRITVTNTKGQHNFKIDEFDVFAETPLNKPVVIEFVADTVGEFVYYCAKPNHRENGHWGTLIVTE